MINVKTFSIVHVVLFSFALPAFGMHLGMHSGDKLINTLEYIARGYEANAQSIGPVKISGRVFNVQRAREGHQIPENKKFPPRWIDINYVQKNGKRRLERAKLLKPNERFYALDNNKKLFAYAEKSVLYVYPLTDEEFRWSTIADLISCFSILEGASGKENVGRAMRSYIKKIKEGKFKRYGLNMTVDINEVSSLIKIVLKGKRSVNEFVIASDKGFNLVRRTYKYVRSSGEFWRDFEGEYEYSQLDNGAWVLSKGQYKYSLEENLIGERRFELTKIQTDVEIPDEIFEVKSLNIPKDLRIVDYSVSPLETKKDGSS